MRRLTVGKTMFLELRVLQSKQVPVLLAYPVFILVWIQMYQFGRETKGVCGEQ